MQAKLLLEGRLKVYEQEEQSLMRALRKNGSSGRTADREKRLLDLQERLIPQLRSELENLQSEPEYDGMSRRERRKQSPYFVR